MPHVSSSPNLDYIRKLYAPQDSLLLSIDATLTKLNKAINVGPEEGKILQMFITLYGIKTVVEVGTLAGYSAIWMARALPEDGQLYTLERDKENADMARHFFDQCEVKSRITLIEGDAHDSLAQLSAKGPFDMIFIDADKLSYLDYLDWAEANLRQFGLIVADNTLLFGTMGLDAPPPDMAPATWHAMRLFNDRLADPAKYFSVMLPTQDGLTVAAKLF